MKKLILTAIVALVLAFNSFSQVTEFFANECIEKMDAFVDSKKETITDNGKTIITIVSTVPSFYDLELVMLTIKSADVYSDVRMDENWKRSETNSYGCIYNVNMNPILISYLPSQNKVLFTFIPEDTDLHPNSEDYEKSQLIK